MNNWTDYKNYVKSTDSDGTKYIAECEEQAAIVSAIIRARNEQGLSQRDLAAICNIPQSSVARIESMQTTPNLSTLLKILRPLGLKLTINK